MVHRVLLAEPDSDAGRMLRRCLRHRGYIACQLEHSRVLAWARQHQPELIVLGHQAEDPFSACLALKLHPETNPLPVIQCVPGDAPLFPPVEPDASLSQLTP